ncbi:unnamed protein product [Protopolystoma xenopodis]|uniref:Uncharacterized protein n=1 Tax=Protopolystoma xenopodis TaxID=117903 RepID=A0A3S5BLD3_9PLAT|nr:unnamed protein product [Protopolystoma xenopodis]
MSHSDCFTLGSSSSCCSSGQFNSARSTDGGGSSRRSSLGHASSCQSIVVVSNLLPAATASLATTAPSTVCNAPTTNLAPFPTSTTSTSFASESIGVTLSPSPSPATSSASSASPCPSPSPPAPAPAPSPATVRQLPTQPSHGPHTFAQATGHSSPPRSICFLASPGGHSSSPLGCSSASGNITSAAAQQGQTAFSASTVSGGDIITPVSVAASRLIYAASSASASASLGGASPIDLADYEPSM